MSSSFPLIADYRGGGTILNEHTSLLNVRLACRGNEELMSEVMHLIFDGNEVIVSFEKIKAVGPYTNSHRR